MSTATERTFENPILPGFYPDPSLCRVGDDFYLVASSFEYFPGIPLFHSRDLVHWRQLGHVLSRESQLPLAGVASSAGIYAPTLRHAGGRFYVVSTNVGGGGNFYVTAERPEGPWSEPIWIDAVGMDPSFAFLGEEVIYTRDGPGPDFDHPLIYAAPFDVVSGRIAGEMRPIFAGTGGIWPEASHLFQRDGFIYLVIAEGGTAYDHSVVVARSRSPYGPFEPYGKNPVLTHADRPDHPIQSTGHADLVELPDSSWWAVLLGVRPIQPQHHLIGRETFLVPVRFTQDGWPLLGDGGRAELTMAAPSLEEHQWPSLPERDDFDAAELRHEYVFLRNPHVEDWSLTARPGHLRLVGSAITLDEVASPALVLRRQQHLAFRCRASLDFSPTRAGELAGITVRADERFRYDLVVGRGQHGREVRLLGRIAGEAREVARVPVGDGPLVLVIEGDRHEYRFSVEEGLERRPPGEAAPGKVALGNLATVGLAAETLTRAGPGMCFTGVMLGLFATGTGQRSGAPADFDWFEYTGA